MKSVPIMISTKDLAYISDMFEWNFTAAKVAKHFSTEVQNEEFKNFILSVFEMHKRHCQKCIEMLGGNYE